MGRILAVVVVGACFAVLPATAGQRLRTVVVVPNGKAAPAWLGKRDCSRYPTSCVNGVGRIELAYVVAGTLPAHATTGTVLTDTDCAPDRNGVSHCGNVIRLAGGRILVTRHDHKMSNDPCLAPGEHVRVKTA